MKHKLTDEQRAIIATDNDIKVDAVAGSGKTTTLLAYAKTRPFGSRILYLVFNKSAQSDSEAKFKKAGIRNTEIKTAHSLAYTSIMPLSTYRLNPKGYKSFDLQVILNIRNSDSYIICAHIKKYMAIFCNSDCDSIKDINYVECLGSENESLGFVKAHSGIIQKKTKELWGLMETSKIEVTHEFYLKKYQLSKPKLNYDYILFDEGQDASPVMLDVFMRQNAKKIIVGDTHQQIYAWRGAINSMEEVNFPSYSLSKSFRFGSYIAQVAKNILLEKGDNVNIEGTACHKNKNIYTEAYISRTNIGLLQEMVSYIQTKQDSHIFFEGNISGLVYTDEGISIYDILNLYNKNIFRIKHKFIKTFSNFNDLVKYAKDAEDMDIYIMCRLVSKYKNGLGDILNQIKSHCVEDRDEADMTFSTTHKAKGLEYDKVHLSEDFCGVDPDGRNKKEEMNILYVAVTRTKKELILPEPLQKYLPDFKQNACRDYCISDEDLEIIIENLKLKELTK